MKYLENFIFNTLSTEVGLSDDRIEEIFRDLRENPDKQTVEGIRQDVVNLLNDPDADWITLVDNDDCIAYAPDSQEDAKNFVLENVCKPLGIELP